MPLDLIKLTAGANKLPTSDSNLTGESSAQLIASTLHQSLISSPSTPVQNYSLNGACSNTLLDSPLLINNQSQNQFSQPSGHIDRPIFSLNCHENSQSSSSSGTVTPSSSLKFQSDLSNPTRIDSTNTRNNSMPNFSQSLFNESKKQTSQTLDKNLTIRTSYMTSLPSSTVSSSSSNSSTASASLSDDSYNPMPPSTQQASSSSSSSSNENDEICPSSSSSSTNSRANSVDALNAESSHAKIKENSSQVLMTQSLRNFNVKMLRPTKKRFYEQRSKSLERIKYTSSYIQLNSQSSKSNPCSLNTHRDDLISQVSKRQNLYLKRNQQQLNQMMLPLTEQSVLGDLKFRSEPNITQSSSNCRKNDRGKIVKEQENILDQLKKEFK
ncbi:hypothetical protein BpHYR1_030739 [Brachionus plicatilis]|uniref:Uncharacterized protein n=1 Tax=Brachionus plicatilis TaxID=10195 RepID=A0A3M7PTG0_BRAPC|nr:hypothetical protein BpHYR1_030739 [Brachionus plicatilis]